MSFRFNAGELYYTTTTWLLARHRFLKKFLNSMASSDESDGIEVEQWDHQGATFLVHRATLAVYSSDGEQIGLWGEGQTEGAPIPEDDTESEDYDLIQEPEGAITVVDEDGQSYYWDQDTGKVYSKDCPQWSDGTFCVIGTKEVVGGIHFWCENHEAMMPRLRALELELYGDDNDTIGTQYASPEVRMTHLEEDILGRAQPGDAAQRLERLERHSVIWTDGEEDEVPAGEKKSALVAAVEKGDLALTLT